MFGMSMTEILVILVIVLVVMGPEKIPDAARMAGKAMRELRKASNLLRDAVMIDEEPPKPKRKPVAPAELPRVDQMDFDAATGPGGGPLPRDPDPKRDMRVVEMSARRAPTPPLAEFELAPARADLVHREVYLHIPYEETN